MAKAPIAGGAKLAAGGRADKPADLRRAPQKGDGFNLKFVLLAFC
jgi:hypothetical protein